MCNNHQILWIDMDAFYVSVEQAFKQYLQNKPVAVGGSYDRDIICTCSYEARKYGIYSGISGVVARSLCPDLICLPINHPKYRETSRNIFTVLSKILPNITQTSIDEGYADISFMNIEPKQIIFKIKYLLKKYFDITCTIGVGCNKMIAKMATSINKPNGYYIVDSKDSIAFIDSFNISDIYGIGQSSIQKLAEHGIFIINDLRKLTEANLEQILGIYGKKLYMAINGMFYEDNHKPEKSISKAVTFSYDLTSKQEMYDSMQNMSIAIGDKLKKEKITAKVIIISTKNYKFESKTYRKTINSYFYSYQDIFQYAKHLFNNNHCYNMPLRLIGVGVSGLKEI